MRLDKALSTAGYTRSEAKAMIAKGRVSVDGAVAKNPGLNVSIAQVCLDGRPIDGDAEIYLMIHKPAGVVTATEDKHFPTVVSLLPEHYQRRKIGPVGRLDRDVTGLVILTTDGQMAHRLISPKWKAEKCYRARCEGALDESHVQAFAQGLTLRDDTVCLSAKLEPLGAGESRITVCEGKYHQVRRMMASRDMTVLYLKREQEGSLTLGTLPAGQVRELTVQEVAELEAQFLGNNT